MFFREWTADVSSGRLERFGENDMFFKEWRSCKTVYSMNGLVFGIENLIQFWSVFVVVHLLNENGGDIIQGVSVVTILTYLTNALSFLSDFCRNRNKNKPKQPLLFSLFQDSEGTSTKGQLISKGLFGAFTFSQKTNENKSTSSKDELFRSFFGRKWKIYKTFRKNLTFNKRLFWCRSSLNTL